MLNKEDKQRYLRLLGYVKPHWKVALLSLGATVVYGLTEPLVPIVLKPLIDGGFIERNLQTVYTMVLILIVGFSIRGFANFISNYTSVWVAQRVVYTLRTEMFKHLLRLPMRYYDQHSHGSLLSRFSYDVVQLMSASTDALITLIREIVIIIALLVNLFILDWRMALIIMTVSPFLTIIIIFISRRLRNMAHAMQEDMSEMNHVVDEALIGREIIRIYNGEDFEYQRFDKQATSVQHHALQSTKYSSLASPTLEVIIIFALSGVILLAANKAQLNPDLMTAGTFTAFLTTMGLLFPPIKRLGKVVEPIQRGLAAAQSIFDFLDEATEPQALLPPASIKHGAIRLNHVNFSYHDQAVLQDFSLDIEAGETIALVGASGSGKSTIAALIAGFYTPDSGNIYIDNHDVNAISLQDRRQAIALVSQNTILFSGTVKDNIAYADPKLNHSRLINAATSANASEFIDALAEGYDSDIGQQGGRLSGGQKQRLAIARALYKNAPILILDEATSALDNRSEHKVQQAIDALRQNRTAIIIAHRLSTIRNADRIVVLDQGSIVESGTHEELLNKGGFYAKLLDRMTH